MQARSIHLSSFDNMFNDRLTVDLQMWTGINVANFSFCRLLCYASIFMCIIWFRSHTVSTFLILTMQEQTAELKLHWWFEFIRLKKMGNADKDGDGSTTSKRQHLTNTLHFEQTELTHFMLSAAAEPLCTTARKKYAPALGMLTAALPAAQQAPGHRAGRFFIPPVQVEGWSWAVAEGQQQNSALEPLLIYTGARQSPSPSPPSAAFTAGILYDE